MTSHLHRSGADEMAGYSGPDELSFEHVVACAILEAGLGPADAQADRMALLASLDTEWTAAELLELEGHTLNPNCNASFTRVVAPELVADQRAGRIAPAQLTSGAWSLAEDLGRSLRSGTPALPVAGCGLRGGLLALFVAPLFIVVGLPVGLCASLLTDWCRTASAPPPRRRHLHRPTPTFAPRAGGWARAYTAASPSVPWASTTTPARCVTPWPAARRAALFHSPIGTVASVL